MIEKKETFNGNSSRYTPEFLEEYREKVEKMSQLGCTDKEIGHIIGMPVTSLQDNFRSFLDRGRSNLRLAIRKAQIEEALVAKNTSLLIWLGKVYLKQREIRYEPTNPEGLTVEKIVYSATLPDDEDDKVIVIADKDSLSS